MTNFVISAFLLRYSRSASVFECLNLRNLVTTMLDCTDKYEDMKWFCFPPVFAYTPSDGYADWLVSVPNQLGAVERETRTRTSAEKMLRKRHIR